jgi:pentatricopeptide repeat protein
MVKISGHSFLIIPCSLLCFAALEGCSSSEEAVKPGTVVMRISEVDSLHNVIADCNSRAATLQHENQTVHALAADLQTEIDTLKARLAVVPPPASKPVIEDKYAAYQSSLAYFKQRRYEDAASLLRRLLEEGPPPDLDDNCQYWLGECAYGLKNYTDAIGYFRKVFNYAKSEKKDDAQIMIANSFYAMGDKAAAKEEYQKFLEKFPASPYAKAAKDRLAKL